MILPPFSIPWIDPWSVILVKKHLKLPRNWGQMSSDDQGPLHLNLIIFLLFRNQFSYHCMKEARRSLQHRGCQQSCLNKVVRLNKVK
jgi:hypothetical protein